MNKQLSLILLTTMLISYSAYAETVKSSKKINSTDINQTMSDEEFMKRFMALDEDIKKEDTELIKIREKNKDLEELDKTLNELGKLLKVNK